MRTKMLILFCLLCTTTTMAQQMVYVGPDQKNQKVIDRYNRCHFRVTLGQTLYRRKSKDFTAIFAISDAMALAAIRALYESGRRVPEDCSVVGIDGLTATQYTIPTLTSLVQPKKELGEQATDILVEMIQGRAGNRQVVLPTSLRRGESVRAC